MIVFLASSELEVEQRQRGRNHGQRLRGNSCLSGGWTRRHLAGRTLKLVQCRPRVWVRESLFPPGEGSGVPRGAGEGDKGDKERGERRWSPWEARWCD